MRPKSKQHISELENQGIPRRESLNCVYLSQCDFSIALFGRPAAKNADIDRVSCFPASQTTGISQHPVLPSTKHLLTSGLRIYISIYTKHIVHIYLKI